MKIIVAENAGFCFGVKRAVDGIKEARKNRGGNIYTLGELIHNQTVLDELKSEGITPISESDVDGIFASASEKTPVTVAIRAHGVEKATEDKLYSYAEKNPYFSVLDLTCPYVSKIHKTVSEHKDRRLIVFGDKNHPEVRGIVSRADGDYAVIGDENEVFSLEETGKPVLAVSQTTADVKKWAQTQKNIKKVFTNHLIFDTICRVTDKRQKASEILAGEVDAMLIIGSRASSNTGKLYDTAKRRLENTFFVETPDDLPEIIFDNNKFRKVGITAGASTPERLIQEVYKKMSEIKNDFEAESFEQMLAESFKLLHVGETVKGTICAVTGNELHVDLGTNLTGIISADEATNETGAKLSDLFKIGDEVEAIVTKLNDRDGVAELSKKRVDNNQQWKKIAEVYESGEVLEGEIASAVKGGVIINFEGSRVFVPGSQTGVSKSVDLSTLVGQTKRFKLIEFDEGKKRAVGSIRKVESEEKKAKASEFWSTVEIGKYYEGAVKSITSFGAFVDLGGVDGMVHTSELSWRRIKSPAEVVSVGDIVKVFIKDVDLERKRISLGYKTEETNPWKIFKDNYNLNDVVEVKVSNLTTFGAFAEIVPGVDGLIHISQISDHKIGTPGEVLSVGQTVTVEIVSIDDDKKQVGLSIRSLLEAAKEGNEVAVEATEGTEATETEA